MIEILHVGELISLSPRNRSPGSKINGEFTYGNDSTFYWLDLDPILGLFRILDSSRVNGARTRDRRTRSGRRRLEQVLAALRILGLLSVYCNLAVLPLFRILLPRRFDPRNF